MSKNMIVLVLALFVSGVALNAQAPKPPAPAKAAPEKASSAPKPAPEPPAQPVNIKIEVSITDQTGSNAPAKKLVSMIVGDRQSTSIRSSASVPVRMAAAPGAPVNFNYRNVTINVDARPWIQPKEPNKILVTFGLEYFPKTTTNQEEMEPGMASINERLGLIFESGKPVVVSQAADPTSDRKITVEVTATILK
jgi:hypothetical protein